MTRRGIRLAHTFHLNLEAFSEILNTYHSIQAGYNLKHFRFQGQISAGTDFFPSSDTAIQKLFRIAFQGQSMTLSQINFLVALKKK